MKFLHFIQRLLEAFRHVRSGGKTTRRRARARAAAPPAKCPTCRQPVQHSQDWRDHIDHGHTGNRAFPNLRD